MIQTVKLAPPNSLILVMDPRARVDIPKSIEGSLVSATASSIAVACRAEIDGETDIRLGWDREVDPGTTPAYVGRLDIPTGTVSIRTVVDHEVLSLPVGRKQVTVRVWTNDPTEPTEVGIGISLP